MLLIYIYIYIYSTFLGMFCLDFLPFLASQVIISVKRGTGLFDRVGS